MYQRVPNTAEARIFWSLEGDERLIENVLHFTRAGGYSNANLDTLLDVVHSYSDDAWSNKVPDTAKLLKISVRGLDEEFDYETENTDDWAGSNEASYLPINNAIYTRFVGQSGGAPRRGGAYFPFAAEVSLDDVGRMSDATAQEYSDTWSDWMTNVADNAGGWYHSIVSRYHKTAGGTAPYLRAEAVTNIVVAYTTRTIIASQRDRRPTV